MLKHKAGLPCLALIFATFTFLFVWAAPLPLMPAGLAAEGQSEPKPGQVLVVMLYDQHCSLWCGKVRPIMKELAQDLGERVFVDEIDVSKGQEKSAEEKCKQLGILSYYKDIESVPVVMVFDARRKLAKELNGPKSKELYRGAIEKVLK